MTYPSGAVITYTPDSAGRVLSAVDASNNINYVTGATYNAPGALTGSTYGQSGSFGGILNSFSFNSRLQPVNLWSSSPTRTLMNLIYDFHLGNGDNGNVWGITNNRDTTRSQSFTYDALNRLVSAQNAGTDCGVPTLMPPHTKFWGNSYGYDAWGNLKQKIVTKCMAENLSMNVDGSNRALGGSYLYDAAGNMLRDNNGTNYTYDVENRISSTTAFTYTYDADGNRVEKVTGTTPPTGTLYWYMTPGIVAESDLSGNLKTEYIFFDGQRVARKDFPGKAVSYYFSDHLKTASVVTDASGTILDESDYYPWGGELPFVNNLDNHYKFTGKERDAETGLDYFGARHYSNGLGRFITPDWAATPEPIPYADLTDPQSLNQYSYVRNIPTTNIDVDGHCFWDLCIAETYVVVAGAVAITAAVLTTPAGQQALKAVAHGIDKATDWAAERGNELVRYAAEHPGKSAAQQDMDDLSGRTVKQALAQSQNTNSSSGQQGNSGQGNSTPADPNQKKPSGPVKAKDAPGVTAGGQATNKHGQKLAPSGRPQINNVNKTTREAANNAANKGSGTMQHPNPTRGGPHFHTRRGDGSKKQDGTHYNYPE